MLSIFLKYCLECIYIFFLIGGFILVIKVLKKRVKDFISGNSRETQLEFGKILYIYMRNIYPMCDGIDQEYFIGRYKILMKWYIGLGVICIVLVICAYNMYNGYEQKDIEIETGLLEVFNESKLGREKQDYEYIEILMRTEEELMKYKNSFGFLEDLGYIDWKKECIILTSYPIERCTYKRKNKHNKYYLLDILYKNKDRDIYVYIINGKKYIRYETAGMYKEMKFK